jgi:hypothetical protein
MAWQTAPTTALVSLAEARLGHWCTFAVALMGLTRVSEFLYFQF